MLPDHKGRTGLFVFVDRLSNMVRSAPCNTKFSDKEAAFLFLDHVYRLNGMLESIVSYRDPLFTSGFWRHEFKLHGRKLHMSIAIHPPTDGQTERSNRVVADVLRTIPRNGANICCSSISLLTTVFTLVRVKRHLC